MWHTCGMAFGWVYKDAAADAVRVSPWTREEAEEIIGDPMVHVLAMRRFREDVRFGDSPCIDRDYPGEWVAIQDLQVVGHDSDWRPLQQALKEGGKVDMSRVYYRQTRARPVGK